MPLFDMNLRSEIAQPADCPNNSQQQDEQRRSSNSNGSSKPAPLFAINANGSGNNNSPQQPAPLFAIAPPKQEQSQGQQIPAPLFSISPPPKEEQKPAPLFSISPQPQQQQKPAPLFASAPSITNDSKQEQAAASASPPPPSRSAPAPLFAISPGPNTNGIKAKPAQQPTTPAPAKPSNTQEKPKRSSSKKNNKPLFDLSASTKNPLFAPPPNAGADARSSLNHNSVTATKPLFDMEQGQATDGNAVETTYEQDRPMDCIVTTDVPESIANSPLSSFSKLKLASRETSFKVSETLQKAPSFLLSMSKAPNASNASSHDKFQDDDDDDDSMVRKGATQNSRDDDSVASSSVGSLVEKLKNRTGLMVSLIVVLGVGAAAAFLAIGVSGGKREQTDQFQRTSVDMVTAVESQFDRYVTAANYVHHYCRNHSFTRQDFRSLYEYLIADGLDFKAVQFDPNVTREERPKYEAEARDYYAKNYPHVNYRGFVGFDDGVQNGLVPTGERDFYFPIHYMEPVRGNEAAIDLDYYSHISRRQTLNHCFEYGEPAITDRLALVTIPGVGTRCGGEETKSYGVVLMHPGVNISDPAGGVWPRDLSSIVLCIPGLLKRSTEDLHVPMEVYIHDGLASSGEVLFLGGVKVDENDELTYLDEVEVTDIKGAMKYTEDLYLTNKVWRVTVVAANDTYKPNLTFVIVGGVLVLLASVSLGLWVHTNTRRSHKFNAMKAKVEGEKAALILENTRQAARAERELNDFIAHEVRNPVAAAMAACSFVKSAVNETEPLVDPQKREDTREDVGVIYNSLQFINDLLRNMLDMHRASHKQLQVNFETIDLYHDILQSTAGMIYQRDSKVKVIVECEPQSLLVQSDCLRLKQVILNLSRNATKFVNEGFIRLKGYVVDNEVRLAVQDSGIGIPPQKQDALFGKFQESLDRLSQGTGIGLYLCKNLVELMGGEIFLDKTYDSGVPGNPGTSIIINLKRPPLSADDLVDDMDANERIDEGGGRRAIAPLDISQSSDEALLEQPLPDHLNVLFVDDDAILRKLFARSVRRVAPGWTMREASNGESAIQFLDEGLKFDLIFVDQYMASIEKQLLGTETILEMRARGCESRLFGLSANDLEAEFMAAGADGFVIKPFPTETDALKLELVRAVHGKRAYYAQR